MHELSVSFVESITEVGIDYWNALAGTDYPFMRYEFLCALETTGCTTRASGWRPHHAIVRQVSPGLDEIVAILPLYLKTNSWGEYVFDWSWANAYQSHGLDYYPKFVTAAPFTPSTGQRLLLKEGQDAAAVIRLLQTAIEEKADFIRASSWHVLFPNDEQHDWFTDAGLLPRTACQFHWFNRNYASFDDFLAGLNSRKRKNLKKERAKVREEGISFRHVEGADIDETLWQGFYAFYQSTYLMRGMQGYLTPEFFIEMGQSMPEQMFMVCAEQEGRLIAAALFFKSGEALFGRYWGSAKDYQFLHFETCYYQGQEYAIANGFKRFDSGAQGEHKIQRGFEPLLTYSNHWIAHPDFRDAIGNFLIEEDQHIERYRSEAQKLLPFRQEQE
jgi:hypothetical protein